MKEFDFDELDKAVNSLMGTVANDPVSSSQSDDVAAVDIPDSPPNAPSSLQTETSAHDSGFSSLTADNHSAFPPTSTSERPVIAPRKSGRFMDMVHAAGDPTKVAKAPSELPSRISRTVAPSGGAPIADVMKSAHSQPASHAFVGSSAQETAAAPDEPQAFEGAEPTESPVEEQSVSQMSSSRGISLQPLSENVVPEPLEEKVEDTPTYDQPDPLSLSYAPSSPAEVQSSPFIPDAKVDKRPLGGELVESAPVPEELSQDLMSIEAGESTSTPARPIAAPHEEVELERSSPEDQPTVVPIVDERTVSVAKITPAVTTPETIVSSQKPEALLEAGPISIPQQYRETPSTGDQSNGAIYDTASYHQPLSHPAKKRSSWWIVLLILLIIAFGAGAGAFFYFQGYF